MSAPSDFTKYTMNEERLLDAGQGIHLYTKKALFKNGHLGH
jgi:hypothetical protein